jgi:hypothetical protein
MSALRFIDDIPSTAGPHGGGKHRAAMNTLASDLRQRPGTWAIVAEKVTPSQRESWVGKQGTRRAHLPASVETSSRKIDGEINIYARWTGEAE